MDRCQIYVAIALLGILKSVSCQDFSLNLISRVPEGVPGVDYPTYTSVPRRLSFTCRDRKPGFYADPETRCQAWHWCDTFNIKHSFICSNMTLFNQKIRGCDWWYNVDCDLATSQYSNNDELYQNNHQPIEQSDQERRHANDEAQRRQKQLEDAAAFAAVTAAPDQGVAESIDGAVHPNNAHQPPPDTAIVDTNNNVDFNQHDSGATFTSGPIVTEPPHTFATHPPTPAVTFAHSTTDVPRGFQQVRPLTNRFPGSPNNFIANIPNAIPIAFPPPRAPRPNVHTGFVQPAVQNPAIASSDDTSGISTLTADDNLLINNFQRDNNGHTNFGSFVSTTNQEQFPTSTFAQQPEVHSFATNQPEVHNFATSQSEVHNFPTNQPDVTTIRQRVPSARGRPGSFQGPFFASSTAPPNVFVNAPTTTHIPTPSPSSGFDFGVHVDPVTNRIFTFDHNSNSAAPPPPAVQTEGPVASTFSNNLNTLPVQQFTTAANINNQFFDTETRSTLRDDDDVDDDRRDFQRFNSLPPVVHGFGGGSLVDDTNNELASPAGEPAGPSTINLDEFFAETAPLSTSPRVTPSTTPRPIPRQSQFRPFSPRTTTPQRHIPSARPTFQSPAPAHASFAPVITSTTAAPTTSHQTQSQNAVPAAPSPAFNLAIPFGARLRNVPLPESNNVLDNSATVRRHDASGTSGLSTKRSAVDTIGSSTTSRQIVVRASITSAATTATTTTSPPTTTVTPIPSTTATAPPPSTMESTDTTSIEPEEFNSLPSSTFEPSRRRKFARPNIRSRGPTFPPFHSSTTTAQSTEEAVSESVATSSDDTEVDISTTVASFAIKPFRTKRRKTPRTIVTHPTTTTTPAESNELFSSTASRVAVNSTGVFQRLTTTSKPTKFLKTAATTAATESASGLVKRRTFPSFPITTFRPSTPFQLQSRGRVVDGRFGERQQRRHPSTATASITEESSSTASSTNNNVILSR